METALVGGFPKKVVSRPDIISVWKEKKEMRF